MQNSVSMTEIMEDATTYSLAYRPTWAEQFCYLVQDHLPKDDVAHSGLGPPISMSNQSSLPHTSQSDLGS